MAFLSAPATISAFCEALAQVGTLLQTNSGPVPTLPPPQPAEGAAASASEVASATELQNTAVNKVEGKVPSVLIHCAAGVHRTGIFAYSLLRLSGVNMRVGMGGF